MTSPDEVPASVVSDVPVQSVPEAAPGDPEVPAPPVPYAKLAAAALRHRLLHRLPWRSPHHGYWSDDPPNDGGPLQRIADASAVLPTGGAIGGWAAAYLHGAHALDGIDRDGSLLDVMICVAREQQVRRAGIDDFRSALHLGDVTTIGGLPVTSLCRTAFDLARRAEDRAAAVCALDAIGHATDLDFADVAQYAQDRPRWLGSRQVLGVVGLADRRSLSPYETRLRLLWMLDAGLPRPECNVPLFSESGGLLGYPDLFDPGSGVIGEYDGAHHRDPDQQSSDNAREERFERHGLIVVRAGVRDLFGLRTETVERLRAAYHDGLERDRRRDRWSAVPPPGWRAPTWFRPHAA